MAKLTETAVGNLARTATYAIMKLLEQHVDAHPLRFGGELPEEAYEELRERIEHSQLALLRDIEIPPK